MLNVVPSAEPEVFLEKQRVVLKGRPSVAGVLLFTDEPQAILPKRSAIKVFRYRTKDEGERDTLAFDPVTVEGPIYDLIYRAVDKCKEVIESIQKLGASGLESVSYPEEALHEIVTNAVLHRDYSLASDVQIRIFDDRIEIESPGKFPGHVNVKNVLDEQFARNPRIVRLVNKFPNAPNKDVGEGLNTAFEAMEKLRLKAPTIEETNNSVIVTLRHEKLASPEQLVMEYLQAHDEITNLIARDLTGIRSENSMKDVFYRLRNRGLLEQVPGKIVGNKAAWRKKAPVPK
jgi:ATP-dependent DNA helicase RecG